MPLLEFSCQLQYPSGFRVEPAFTADAPVTALFGPSGSGKTSILSMIAGLRRPDAGFIRFGTRLLFDSGAGVDLPPEQRRVGYVFQDHLLFPHLDVRGNLLYGWRRRARVRRPSISTRLCASWNSPSFFSVGRTVFPAVSGSVWPWAVGC